MNKAEFKANAVRELPNTYSNALPAKGAIMELAGVVYDGLKPRGTKTAAQVAALTEPLNGDAYQISTGGNLNSDDDLITVVSGDVVTYNGETGLWEKSIVSDVRKSPVKILTDNYTLTEGDSESIICIATDAKVITLPATKAGLKYTIINTGAAANNIVTVSPQAADGISGTITLAATVVVDAGVVNKDIINTQSTAKAGDSITLVGTGVPGTTAWIIVASTGIWAAEG